VDAPAQSDESPTTSVSNNVDTPKSCLVCNGGRFTIVNKIFSNEPVLDEYNDSGILVSLSCLQLIDEAKSWDSDMSINACKTLNEKCVSCNSYEEDINLKTTSDENIGVR